MKILFCNAPSSSAHLPGHPLHNAPRSHNYDSCFFAEENFHTFRHCLGESPNTSRITLRSNVRVPNLVHLRVTPRRTEDALKLVTSLGQHHVQHPNVNFGRK